MLSPCFAASSVAAGRLGGKCTNVSSQNPRMHEGPEMVVRHAIVVHEGTDGLLRRHVRQLLDLLGRAAEAGAAEEMLGTVVAPVRRRDRGQIARPGGGPRLRPRQARRTGDAGDDKREHGTSHCGTTEASSRHELDPLIANRALRPTICHHRYTPSPARMAGFLRRGWSEVARAPPRRSSPCRPRSAWAGDIIISDSSAAWMTVGSAVARGDVCR